MPKQKAWGSDRCIKSNGCLAFHRIEVNAGGFCSEHLHAARWNGFYVESGTLEVLLIDDQVTIKETLQKGDWLEVEPGQVHQFRCIEDAVVFEVYWPDMGAEDIERFSVGGAKC